MKRIEATFSTSESIGVLVARLEESLAKEKLVGELLPLRTRLGGKVSDNKVNLHRDRGGRRWYLKFEGELKATTSGTTLKGAFVSLPPSFAVIWALLLPAIMAGFVIAKVTFGSGTASWPHAALLICLLSAIPVVIWRFREMNIRAEREMLDADIHEFFGRSA